MTSPFMRALPIVAKALSESYGISLEIRGHEAMTDGRRIILPVLPEDDRRALVLARGYLDHETGHVKHTDFTVPRGTGLEGSLTNILEDIRVEQAMSRRYPGCRENLAALVHVLVAEGDFKPPQPADPPAQVVQALVLYLGRARILGQQALAPLAAQAQAVFDQVFPGLRPQVEAVALEVRNAPDTRTVQDLARRICDLFKEAAQPPAAPEPDPQAGGQDSGSPDPQDPAEPQADATAQAQEEPKPQPGDQDSPPPGCHPAGASDDLAAAAAAALADDAGYHDLGHNLAEKMGAISAQDQDGPALAVEVDPWWDEQPIADQEVKQATARLRAMLAGVVQAKRAARERPSRSGTRLDLRGLPKLAVNDGKVFRSRQERPAVNTAVYLLLDQSYSMKRSSKIRVAFQTTVALALGLRSIPGTAVAAGSFSATTAGPFVARLLEFGESDRRLSLAIPPPEGGTPMAEALYCVAAKLLRRPEPRQMLVVMTDGEPDTWDSTQEVVAKCRSAGVEVYGVGILSDAVEPLFGRDNAVVVQSIGELPGKLFRLLAERM